MNLGELKNVKQLAPAAALWLKSHGHKPDSSFPQKLRKFSALASKDYSSQSDEKSNTKSGVGGVAQAPSSEGNRHECDCVPIWGVSYVLSFFTIRRVTGTATVNGQRR